jgi:hypothetical protein
MKFSFDLQIFANGRESSFLMLNMMNTPNGAMTNTAEMAYQIFY